MIDYKKDDIIDFQEWDKIVYSKENPLQQIL
jgi:hypothetical protein